MACTDPAGHEFTAHDPIAVNPPCKLLRFAGVSGGRTRIFYTKTFEVQGLRLEARGWRNKSKVRRSEELEH